MRAYSAERVPTIFRIDPVKNIIQPKTNSPRGACLDNFVSFLFLSFLPPHFPSPNLMIINNPNDVQPRIANTSIVIPA